MLVEEFQFKDCWDDIMWTSLGEWMGHGGGSRLPDKLAFHDASAVFLLCLFFTLTQGEGKQTMISYQLQIWGRSRPFLANMHLSLLGGVTSTNWRVIMEMCGFVRPWPVCYFLLLPTERCLEDHELVAQVQASMSSESKFVFRKNYAKYEFFKNPLVSSSLALSYSFYFAGENNITWMCTDIICIYSPLCSKCQYPYLDLHSGLRPLENTELFFYI